MKSPSIKENTAEPPSIKTLAEYLPILTPNHSANYSPEMDEGLHVSFLHRHQMELVWLQHGEAYQAQHDEEISHILDQSDNEEDDFEDGNASDDDYKMWFLQSQKRMKMILFFSFSFST
ncbi:unnamed protein product [Leptidea sinapis]|uniref:Uncharacterized protein n=1 Tax=Leptidea sinapis TaxID=189913 RepID=A0A5E4PNH5_9NEOP|nr:unnamed protein product [Leptidea sinapis]